ncbi:hypothetical protein EFP84_15545 [Leptospira kmetyi]|uniref:Uncharacterized protein n=1 Tax=Leptospira kmetyi TaxID=408139 RepID=A0AAD0XQX8_9LEPT|nr:hypothetical protein EFP84_15545 [Leptospira kmetyi]
MFGLNRHWFPHSVSLFLILFSTYKNELQNPKKREPFSPISFLRRIKKMQRMEYNNCSSSRKGR